MLIVPADDVSYDVFISYRRQEPDRTWVRERLVPRLRAKGLRVCIDDESFRLGEPLVLEMARAVEQSRYTLAILSPAYLRGNFAELENVLAEHLGLEQGRRRLLLVVREPCTPRLGLRARLWLDLTDDASFEPGITRLVSELRRPLEPAR
jgi:TIR domain